MTGRILERGRSIEARLSRKICVAMASTCKDCDRSFATKKALGHHLRDSPAHAVTFDCKKCDRSFHTKEALQQHLCDLPAHAVTFGCEECDRPFHTEEALQQHLRDSPAHSTSFDDTPTSDSYDMHPSLYQDVSHLLRQHSLFFRFRASVDSYEVLREHDTTIMGRFTCANQSCPIKAWTSKQIAITIRQYSGLKYNARVYHQRCKSCNSLSRPELDNSYAERVSYRLAEWSGIVLEEPPYSGHSRKPRRSRLCEGCMHYVELYTMRKRPNNDFHALKSVGVEDSTFREAEYPPRDQS